MKEQKAYDFWKRVDYANTGHIIDLCKTAKIDYNRMKHNRSDCRLPKLEDAYAIARALGVSVEYLLAGEVQKNKISDEAQSVEKDPNLRMLVRLCQKRPELLSLVQTIVNSDNSYKEDII